MIEELWVETNLFIESKAKTVDEWDYKYFYIICCDSHNDESYACLLYVCNDDQQTASITTCGYDEEVEPDYCMDMPTPKR